MRLAKTALLTLLSACLSFAALPAQTDGHNFEVGKNLDIFNSLYKELDLYYVDTLDASRTIKSAIDYMMWSLDPYTEYYPGDKTNELKQLTTGKYAGIGAYIRYYKPADRTAISEPFENTPAAKAGLRAGDVIMAIDGKDIGTKGAKDVESYNESVSSRLRGEAGTTVSVRIMRPGEKRERTIDIVRESIRKPSVAFARLLPGGVGIVALDDYTENSARDLRRAVVDLKKEGATSLIIDLRDNGGGLMSEAVSIVNMFIPRGKPVVETKGKVPEVRHEYKTTEDPFDTEMPLVVLVNENTASAAEITSGALQDYDRAVIIGRRTYGKGLVQSPRELPFGAAAKITTSKYYIPSGRCVQKYDFKNRRDDGTSSTATATTDTVPDSLVTTFHTAGGRPVQDRGGILPDIVMPDDSLPTLLTHIAVSTELFDYANHYRSTHASIAPAADFTITEADYADFSTRLINSDFTYDRQSGKALDVLRKVAAAEGYLDEARSEFEALEKRLSHNLDFDLRRWKPEITRLINAEIVRRYHYERGVAENTLKDDKYVARAAGILTDAQAYRKILAPQTKD